MRIVIDMEGIQCALHQRHDCGNNRMAFVEYLCRHRGDHDIILAVNGLHAATIEHLRSVFDGLICKDNLRIWYATPSNGQQGHGWHHPVDIRIRQAFLASLNPDLVHFSCDLESYDPTPDDHMKGLFPVSTSLFEMALQRNGGLQSKHSTASTNLPERLKRADLVFMCSHIVTDKEVSVPDFAGDNIVPVIMGLTEPAQQSQKAIPLEHDWESIAKQVLSKVEQWHRTRKQTATHAASNLPKLAYLSPLPPARSGISSYSAELLPELAYYYDIEIIVEYENEIDERFAQRFTQRSTAWFKEHASTYDRVLYHFGNSPFHSHMFDLLKQVPGVVVLHDFFLSGVVAFRDKKKIAPGSWAAELYRSHGYKALERYIHRSEKEEIIRNYPCNATVLRDAVGVIVHSDYSRQLALQYYGNHAADNWQVIPHLRVPAGKRDKADARKILGVGENDFLVCSFGLLGLYKLNHRLIDAWIASRLAADPACTLILVGENDGGEYGKKLLKTINTARSHAKIVITGWADMATFRNYLTAADMAVQLRANSRGETSGTVLDCMNYGLATIVNANGSMAELTKETVCMLPDDFSDQQLVSALETLYDNPQERARLGTNAERHIRNDHAPRHAARLYSQAIEQFSRSPRSMYMKTIESVAVLDELPADNAQLMDISEAIAKTFHLKPSRQQLLIDVSALVKEDLKTGIQRVVRSIVKTLIDNPPSGYRIEPVYAAHDHDYRYARAFTLNALDCSPHGFTDDPVEIYPHDILFIPDLHFQVAEKHRHFYQAIRNGNASVIFLVHDILPVLYPGFFPPNTYKEFSNWLSIVAEADSAICVSRTVADDLNTWMNQYQPDRKLPFRIGWNHHGADIDASIPSRGQPDDFDTILKKVAARPTVLMVGTIEPRKGHELALLAMEELWRQQQDINLVIVGKHGWMTDKLAERLNRHKEKNRRLFWLQGISDEALLALYKKAAGVLMASEGEGFGLPLIEAAQHGIPILARNIPVFREIGKDYVRFFDGNTPPELAASIKEWIRQIEQHIVPDSRKMPWKTWRQSTEMLADMLTNQNHHNWVHSWKKQV